MLSGRLVRTDDGYIITVNKGGTLYSYNHTGPMNKEDLLQIINQVKTNLDYSKLSNEDRRSLGMPVKRPRSVTEGGALRIRKASNRVDAVVKEQNGGFTVTGTDPADNVAGVVDGEHWIKVTWNPVEYGVYDLSERDRDYLSRHVAAIAHKTEPGAEPQIEYFTNVRLADRKFEMLKAKHGTPGNQVVQNTDQDTVAPARLQGVDSNLSRKRA